MLKNIDITNSPSPEQMAMLKRAAELPFSPDNEYPEFSEAELLQFKKPNHSAKVILLF